MNSLLFYKIKISANFKLLFTFFISFLFLNNGIIAQNQDFIVVLDAGHGGKDPGKVGYKNHKEKDIALKIVLEVGKLLENEKNIKVVYTRKTDVFIGLKERGKIANKADANLFVSIHCNAHHTQASGAETWALGTHANKQNFEVAKAENSVILLEDNYKVNYKGFDPNSPESVIGLTLMQEEYLDQSILLASMLQNGFSTDLKRKDRGVKQAGFVVLHQTYMPSVLIETGFITNKAEGTFLGSKAGQSKFSTSIYNGILKYYKQLTLNTVNGDNIVVNSTENKVVENTSKEHMHSAQFKVQVASGTRKLETKSYNFKGLKGIERVKVGNSYKYYLGNTSNYNEIIDLQRLAKSKGYKTAFIVAFKDGKKVDLEYVLKKS
ncbi:N-acetylmuramoyl-L-alanine amidase [Lutibacter agarilyticus]|uniref:N-acetylmuramoyl-L-alanine amidase n=1 Tax=Lutibacter agarilyticus TaxID=1109740 RepID=A0A238X157_9FLAO|nr:N-acetylmuramoyl-L-alanine amidase [Lutibacter agarilyticus]SNR52607.1 N-acetylmuramoyl-L-alanine amidase [Lutibacter agarilyticus]